jgi:hypothetical protein
MTTKVNASTIFGILSRDAEVVALDVEEVMIVRARSMPADDPFDILGVPPSFDLAREAIEKAAMSRVLLTHPDTAGLSNGQHDDEEAAVAAARIHAARDVLLHEESRADALLLRLGGPSREADRSLPAGFLMEILEVRESLEAAVARKDQDAIATWKRWGMAQRADLAKQTSALFARAIEAPSSLQHIRPVLNRWRYIERLIDQLDESSRNEGRD